MKPRTVRVIAAIANDSGAAASYCVRPLRADELGESVAAFRVENLTTPPYPIYIVRLHPSGLASCDCPEHLQHSGCKHADALAAAGFLPAALLSVLQERTRLLDLAEAECQRLAEAAMAERMVHEHDAQFAQERIADLAATVDNLAARALQLQTALAAIPPARPKRNRPAKAKAA